MTTQSQLSPQQRTLCTDRTLGTSVLLARDLLVGDVIVTPHDGDQRLVMIAVTAELDILELDFASGVCGRVRPSALVCIRSYDA